MGFNVSSFPPSENISSRPVRFKEKLWRLYFSKDIFPECISIESKRVLTTSACAYRVDVFHSYPPSPSLKGNNNVLPFGPLDSVDNCPDFPFFVIPMDKESHHEYHNIDLPFIQ